MIRVYIPAALSGMCALQSFIGIAADHPTWALLHFGVGSLLIWCYVRELNKIVEVDNVED